MTRRPPKNPIDALAYHLAYQAAHRDFILAHPHLRDLYPAKEVEDALRAGPSTLSQCFVGLTEACERGALELKKKGPSR